VWDYTQCAHLAVGEDYDPATSPPFLTVTPIVSSLAHCFNISTTSDEIIENDEDFTVSIESVDRAVTFASPIASVVIVDQPVGE
jgi:hypothetical protein